MRWLRLFVLLIASWCVMVLTHESGHLLGGWLGGGTLRHAELRPWRLPHSHFVPDPHPLLTLWAGPVLGVTFPLAIAAISNRRWLWLIANFCLLANGTYLAIGWISGGAHLDTTRLLDQGTPAAAILAYCLITIGFGYPRFRSSCIEVLSSSKLEE